MAFARSYVASRGGPAGEAEPSRCLADLGAAAAQNGRDSLVSRTTAKAASQHGNNTLASPLEHSSTRALVIVVAIMVVSATGAAIATYLTLNYFGPPPNRTEAGAVDVPAVSIGVTNPKPDTQPEDPPKLPGHCRHDEFVHLNARMRMSADTTGAYRATAKDKYLSICTDEASEPFGRVTYRFGRIGHVELERVATPSRPFGIFSRFATPNSVDNVLFFSEGPYTYCVFEAGGAASGIGLRVLRSGTVILRLVSGGDAATDYNRGNAGIDFETANSPVFLWVDTSDQDPSPCD